MAVYRGENRLGIWAEDRKRPHIASSKIVGQADVSGFIYQLLMLNGGGQKVEAISSLCFITFSAALAGAVVDIHSGVSMIIIFFRFSSAYFIASRQIGVVLTGPIMRDAVFGQTEYG